MGDISESGLALGRRAASRFVVEVTWIAGGLLGAEAGAGVVVVVVAALGVSRRAASCCTKASRAT